MSFANQTLPGDFNTTPDVYLEVHRNGTMLNRLHFKGEGLTVGRVVDCDVMLDDPIVSRHHARIEVAGHNRWRISDLKSHNGTYVNGKVQAEAFISFGDRVEIGPFTLLFRQPTIVEPEPAKTAPPAAPLIDHLTFSDESVSINSLKEIQPPTIAVDQLRILNEFSRSLLDNPFSQSRLVALCQLMLHPKLGGWWAVAVSVDRCTPGAAPAPLLPIEWATPAKKMSTAHLSRSLLRTACERHEPVLASNKSSPDGIGMMLSIGADVLAMAAVAVPITERDATNPAKSTDLLYAVFPPQYGTGEWLALCALAVHHYQQAEAIWSNISRNLRLTAIELDLERARKVQDRLVPKQLALPGLDAAIRFRPCHAVGGDYVDAIVLPNKHTLLVIGDVCGKGLPAAMVATGLHTLVHAVARRWNGLADLSEAIDAHLNESLTPGTFVTLIAMTIDPETGETQTVNGGHPAAVVVAGDGQFRRLGECGGFPVGAEPQTLEVETGRLEPGELMVLFTDGCFELYDETGDMMGATKFCEQTAIRTKAKTPDAAADRLMQMLDDLRDDGPTSDDRTLLVARRK